MNTHYIKIEDNLKNNFYRSESIDQNYSQSFQDLFVLTMLNGKKNGKYLEIGANEPIVSSNTYLLETQFGWKGISVEIIQDLVASFNQIRDQKCICADATSFDYAKEIESRRWKTNQIDYLSLDCEPAMITYRALQQIPFDKYRFSVITYETDLYKDGSEAQIRSREYFLNNGYQLVASNVCNGGNPYEDWYVDPTVIAEEVWKPFVSERCEAKNLLI